MRLRKITLLRTLAITAIIAAGPALAADLPIKAPVRAPVAAMYSWTGTYIGVNVGYSWGKSNDDVSYLPDPAFFGEEPFSISATLKGGLGGVQFGYNWQVQRIVLGIEADIDAAGIKGDHFLQPLPGFANLAISYHAHQEINWLGTVRGRLGFTPADRALFYVTGGFAFAQIKTNSLSSGAPPTNQFAQSNSTWKGGWTAGAGIEWALLDSWTAKIEYLHYDLGHQDLTAFPLAPNPPFAFTNHWTTKGDIVRVGLNYRFGGPVVARY